MAMNILLKHALEKRNYWRQRFYGGAEVFDRCEKHNSKVLRYWLSQKIEKSK